MLLKKKTRNRAYVWMVLLAWLCIGFNANAQEEGAAPAAIYLPLKPAFVVNYGGVGRLKYLKAEISVRVDSTEVANALRHHMPFARNNLVLLFTAQTEETISSQAGKEQLRQDALEEIRNLLFREESIEPERVIDLFFNSFIVQK